MTVAIGALCGWPNDVIGIAMADQMITSGDIEFEQPQPKGWTLLDKRCVAMFFGLTEAQTAIAEQTRLEVRKDGVSDIKIIADIYAKFQREYIRSEAEADILAPLGMTLADLRARPPKVPVSLIEKLSKQMQNYYRASGLSDDLGGAIVIGSDPSGAHIHLIEHGHTRFIDGTGFVAAGGGQWHAESQFMFSRYTRWWKFPEALSLVYAAKKRAEVAPGVGKRTDVVLVFTNPMNVVHMRAETPLLTQLEQIYERHSKKQEDDLASQHAEVKTLVEELLKPPATQPQPQNVTPPAAALAPTVPLLPPAPATKKRPRRQKTE